MEHKKWERFLLLSGDKIRIRQHRRSSLRPLLAFPKLASPEAPARDWLASLPVARNLVGNRDEATC